MFIGSTALPHCPQTTEAQIRLLLVRKLGEGHILPTHVRIRNQRTLEQQK